MRANLLVVGGSGLVGRALLRRCAAAGVRPLALTRAVAPPPDVADLADWQCAAGLDARAAQPAAGNAIQALIGAGPLDVLAQWLAGTPLPRQRRVVALSSTSVGSKPDSPDPAERDLARRLAQGEQRLVAACERIGAGWTLLRPTLIWGEGRDHNISRLAALARRHGRIVLPRFARGLRQPIRADDVAAALLAALSRPQSQGHCLDLPGGETLPYHGMVARIAAALSPPARVWRLPLPASAIGIAARLRLVSAPTAAVLLRMRRDLVFDPRPAADLLGVTPAGFQPRHEDFPEF